MHLWSDKTLFRVWGVKWSFIVFRPCVRLERASENAKDKGGCYALRGPAKLSKCGAAARTVRRYLPLVSQRQILITVQMVSQVLILYLIIGAVLIVSQGQVHVLITVQIVSQVLILIRSQSPSLDQRSGSYCIPSLSPSSITQSLDHKSMSLSHHE